MLERGGPRLRSASSLEGAREAICDARRGVDGPSSRGTDRKSRRLECGVRVVGTLIRQGHCSLASALWTAGSPSGVATTRSEERKRHLCAPWVRQHAGKAASGTPRKTSAWRNGATKPSMRHRAVAFVRKPFASCVRSRVTPCRALRCSLSLMSERSELPPRQMPLHLQGKCTANRRKLRRT
jgi:hypothetical protein